MISKPTKPVIPTDAYLFFPTRKEIKNNDQRAIFDGNIELDEEEQVMVLQFQAFAERNHYTLKPMWTPSMILRFLQANNFKMEKTLNSIKDHTEFRETRLPIQLTDKLLHFLNYGFLYVHGRDHKFRPIVVFNIYKMDLKAFDIQLITEALTFWLEYIVDEFMLPGQVENWVFITNVKGMGLASIAVQSVRKLFSYLQDHYKCRLYRMYLVNASPGVYVPWQLVKKFLDGDTVEKVQFYKSQKPKNLFTHANRDQVEQQFGGTAPNLTQYWPPKIVSSNYFVSEEDKKSLVTMEKYTTLYNSGALQHMKVNEDLLIQTTNAKVQVIEKAPWSTTSSLGLYPTKASTLELTEQVDNIYSYLYDKQKISMPSIEIKMEEKVEEEEEDKREDILENTDFDDEMDENIMAVTPGESRCREFEASFISQLILD